MASVSPVIRLDVRKEAVSLTPLTGSLSARPLDLDFSALLKTVKTRTVTKSKGVQKLQPAQVSSSKFSTIHLEQKQKLRSLFTAEKQSTTSEPKAPEMKAISLSSPKQAQLQPQQMQAQLPLATIPTEVSATPLLISDPLPLLSQTKSERKSETKTVPQTEHSSDQKASQSKPVATDKPSRETVVEKRIDAKQQNNPTPTANESTPTIAKKKTLSSSPEKSNLEEAKLVDTKKHETNSTTAPIDFKTTTHAKPANVIEPAKPLSAPSLPVLVEKLSAEVKQRMRDGERSLELLITAPLIGKIAVELNERDGQWIASFTADNAAMQDMLQRNRDQLSQSLTSPSGIPAEIIVANHNDNTSFREQFAQSNSNSHSASSRSGSHHGESSREAFPLTALHSRSLTATREWIA